MTSSLAATLTPLDIAMPSLFVAAVRGLLGGGLFVGLPAAAQSLSPVQANYRIVEHTRLDNSVAGSTEIQRELFVAVTIAQGTNQRFVATLSLDSVAVTSTQRPRNTLAAFSGATWQAVLTPDGRRVSSEFTMPDKSPANSPLLAPLMWLLPVVSSSATSDTLSHTTVAQSGARRTLRIGRTFSPVREAHVAMRGLATLEANGDLKLNESALASQHDGAVLGSWVLDGDGAPRSGTVSYTLAETVAMAGMEMKRTEAVTVTITRMP